MCSFMMEYDIHTVLDFLTLLATVWVIYTLAHTPQGHLPGRAGLGADILCGEALTSSTDQARPWNSSDHEECMLRRSAAHMAASMSTELPVRGEWACMKQIVAQAALASLAGAAVREQDSGTCGFRLKWKCVRHCLTNCLCVFSGTEPCLLVAGLAHPRTHHPLVLRVLSASTPCLLSNYLHTFSAVGHWRSARP